MRSLSPRVANAFLRRRVKRGLAAATSLREARRVFDLQLPYAPPAGGFRTERIGGVGGEWAGEGGALLLYLHGGAFFAGSPRHYRPIACAFAARGFNVFTPAYRLAPRHPFPAALDDALAVFAVLAERADRIVIAADSAGGGLALSLMVARRDAGLPLPAAAALFSPWTDLAVAGASVRDNEASDPLFSRVMLKNAARAYLGGESSRNPLASPLYGDLRGLPPLLLHASASELLRDDSVRFAARAVEAGVEARVALWADAPHCWQLASALMPEARESLAQAATFLCERAGG
jgi:acetyl esterase/lipase